MKILICTPVFHPSVGGLETMNILLATQLSQIGVEIVLVTDTLSDENECELPFKVIRRPGKKELLKYYLWCDIFFHNAPIIKYFWPALLFRKPFVIAHHSCTYNWNQKVNIQSYIKSFMSLMAHNITVSEAVAKSLGLKADYKVIHNFYDSKLFTLTNSEPRNGFVYVGRLSYEKGIDLLIRAYHDYLEQSHVKMPLTMIGGGYQKEELQALAASLQVSDQITFAGIKRSNELVKELNNNKCLVLPTIVKEAFGIVILEAMSCGCYCIGSDGDGIQEAVGNLGSLFRKGDVCSLKEALLHMDNVQMDAFDDYCEQTRTYLKNFSLDYISSQYDSYFESLLNA